MARKRANGEGSVYRSGGRWYFQGYIDEGHGSVRRKVTARTQAQARQKWDERLEAARLGLRRVGQPKNVEELLNDWLQFRSGEIRYSTRVGYQHAVKAHIIPYLGHRKLVEVTPADIQRWQSTLRAEKNLSPSSIRQARSVLKQAFDTAVRHRDVASNPVSITPPPTKCVPQVQAMTADQGRQLMASIAPESHQARVRVLLALSLGLRQGELLALRWTDIDLVPPATLRVEATLQRQKGKGLVRVDTKTARSRRTIPLAPEHVEALTNLKRAQAALRLASGGTYNSEGYVLLSAQGTPIDPANDRKDWHRLLAGAGLPKFRVHDARHTAATLLLQEGQDVARVQQVLGHSSIRTTVDTYGHLTPADSAEGIARVAERLTG